MNRKERRAQAKINRQNAKKWNFPKNPHLGSASGMISGPRFKHEVGPGGGIHFNLVTEMGKILDTVTNEVTPYDTRSNLTDFNSMNWGNDGGFIIAIVPAVTKSQGRGYFSKINNRASIESVLSDFKTTQLDENWDMLSTFCSTDRAWDHYNDIVDTLHYAVVGYSTIQNIAPLSENRKLCLALKNKKDPAKTMAKYAEMRGVVA